MPLQTGLNFYRKKQTIENFQKERPKGLQDIYEAVENEVKEAEKLLEMMESSFYGFGKTAQDLIKVYLPVIEESMRYCKLTFFKWYNQMEELFWTYEKSLGDPTMEVDFNKDNVAMVIKIINKITSTLSSGFNIIIEKIRLLTDVLKKYCLSFMTAEGDRYLETATNYERQRRELDEAIKINLEDIPEMARLFHSKGINVEEMGSVPRHIASRCQSEHVPFLVMFPAACENIRNAFRGIRKWIQADKGYSTFIQNDIHDLEKRADSVKKDLRIIKSKYSQLEHKIKLYQRDIDESCDEIKRTTSIQMVIAGEDEVVLSTLHEIDSEIEFRQLMLEEIMQKEESEPEDKVESLRQQIQEYQMKRNIQEKRKEDNQRKLDLLGERKMTVQQKKDLLMQTKAERKEIKKNLRRNELDLERLNVNLNKLRDILKYKLNPEVLKKLFFNQSILTKSTVAMKKRQGSVVTDKLNKAILLVAENLHGDWNKLYWNLPFYPSRGQENIQRDIDITRKEFMRENAEGLAKHILRRWRRLHTRANVEDLRESLLVIKRKDIVDLIDSEILVKKAISPDLQHIPMSSARNVRFPSVTPTRKASLHAPVKNRTI